MAILPLYQDLIPLLQAAPPVVPRLTPSWRQYLRFLDETYEPGTFSPGGAAEALEQQALPLARALAPARSYGLEALAERLLANVAPLLPGRAPDLYIATLLFTAPAATISADGKPVITLGVERFRPDAVPGPAGGQGQGQGPGAGTKYWYHPGELAEMIPHEAAHCARMQALGLPPTPRSLTLLDMVMLEGTALVFSDLLLGRETLRTFMPEQHLQWHRANDHALKCLTAPEFLSAGMGPFRKYFSANSPVSGYYLGYSLCQEYLDRYGQGAVTELVALDSGEILRRLGWTAVSAQAR